MIPEWLNIVNSIAWVVGNLLVAYISLALILFVGTYAIIFDPRATSAGKVVFRFMVSLVGVVGLVFIGLFIDPTAGREWFSFPGDVALWRPVVRLAIWAYVAWTVTGLAVVLAQRKWFPHLLLTAEDVQAVKIRKSE